MAIHTHEEWEEVSDKDEVTVNTSRLRETKYETLSPSRALLEEGANLPSTTKQSKVRLKAEDRYSVELHMRMSQETEQTVNGNSATKISVPFTQFKPKFCKVKQGKRSPPRMSKLDEIAHGM